MKKTSQPEDDGSETMAIETIAILNNKEALAHGKIKIEILPDQNNVLVLTILQHLHEHKFTFYNTNLKDLRKFGDALCRISDCLDFLDKTNRKKKI